jgi:hypothetical protein
MNNNTKYKYMNKKSPNVLKDALINALLGLSLIIGIIIIFADYF